MKRFLISFDEGDMRFPANELQVVSDDDGFHRRCGYRAAAGQDAVPRRLLDPRGRFARGCARVGGEDRGRLPLRAGSPRDHVRPRILTLPNRAQTTICYLLREDDGEEKED